MRATTILRRQLALKRTRVTERAAKLKGVTIDMSGAYIDAVQRGAPHAQIIFDRFHVQRLAQDAVDQVRRDQVRLLAGSAEAAWLKKTRWALFKNPWNLSAADGDKLAEVQRANRPLYRAYLLKETLAEIVSRRQVGVAREKFVGWCNWAARSRLAPFKKLAKTIRRHLDGILAFIATGLSNGPIQGLNGKIRTLTGRAYKFHSAGSLIGLILLCCTGLSLHPVVKSPSSAPARMSGEPVLGVWRFANTPSDWVPAVTLRRRRVG